MLMSNGGCYHTLFCFVQLPGQLLTLLMGTETFHIKFSETKNGYILILLSLNNMAYVIFENKAIIVNFR